MYYTLPQLKFYYKYRIQFLNISLHLSTKRIEIFKIQFQDLVPFKASSHFQIFDANSGFIKKSSLVSWSPLWNSSILSMTGSSAYIANSLLLYQVKRTSLSWESMSPPIRLYFPRTTLSEFVVLGTPRMVTQCAAVKLKYVS